MTKKKLLLHIGMGKTGTTALQEFFWENRNLLAQHGICYPEIGSQSAAHHLISPHHPPFLLDIGWKFLAPEEWIKQVQSLPQDRILMSSELMFSGAEERVAPFLDAVCEAFDVSVIAYLRRPDNAIMAAFNQQVKAGEQIRGIDALIKTRLHRFAYLDVLQRWNRDTVEIVARPYERSQFKNGDILADFLSHVLGIESLEGFIIPKAEENANPRLATLALDFKVMINNLISDTEASSKFNAPLFAYSEAYFAESQEIFREQDTLSPEHRAEIIEYFREANEIVAKQFMGRENGQLFEAALCEGGAEPPSEAERDAAMVAIARWLMQTEPALTQELQAAMAAHSDAPEFRIRQAVGQLTRAFDLAAKESA